MFKKVKDLFKSKEKHNREELEWDAESSEGRDVPAQDLPEYSPAAFDVPTERL